MGSIYSNRRNIPPPNPNDYIRDGKIPEGFKEMEKIPKDQFLCPLCGNIPVIKNVHTDNGHIELICKYHGILDFPINDYAKAMKDSMYTYFKIKCGHCNKEQGTEEPLFKYCYYCKLNFCSECVNRFDLRGIDHRRNHLDFCIDVNEKNHKCHEHPLKEFTEYCYDCQENICEKEKTERHRDHKKVNLFTLYEQAAKYRTRIVEKNRILSDIIRFNQLILNSYDKFQDNFFHIQSVINIGKSLDEENKRDGKEMENMIYHLEKSHKAQQEALAKLNEDFKLDFEGNELKLSLRWKEERDKDGNLIRKKLGDIGFQLLSKIQFTDLKDINVSNNSISNISALNDMVLPHLEFINMSENEITDVEPIAKLDSKNLKEIFLQRNRIKDFSPFLRSQFPALERLRIENNNFNKDLQEFKDFIKKLSNKINGEIIYVAKTLDEFKRKYKVEIEEDMKIIGLNDLRAQDILLQELYYVLEPDIKILEISLRNNDIKNVSLISRIPYKSIRIIDLSMNNISNLEFILEMKSKNLRELYLNDNLLNDISCLIKIYDPALHKDNEKEKFPNLKVISLKNNLFKPDNAQSKRVLRLLKGKGIETDIKDDNKN